MPTRRRLPSSPAGAPGSRPATRPRRSTSRRASEADPASEGAAFLALDLLPGTPDAEAIVKRQLAARPAAQNVRLLYVRTLASSQRFPEAAAEVTVLTQNDPNLAPPWLTLGALELEMKRPKQATEACATTSAWSKAAPR
jgi:hypothetical protein